MFVNKKRSHTADQLKKSKEQLNANIRELERDIQSNKESRLALSEQIREAASQGDNIRLRILSTNFVRLREQEKRLTLAIAALRNTNINVQNLAASEMVSQSVQKSSQAIAAVSSMSNNQQNTNNTVKAFAKEADKQQFSIDMVQDTMDAVLDIDDDVEEESNAIVQQVLEEVSMEYISQLKSTPVTAISQQDADNKEVEDEEDELMKKLANLKATTVMMVT